MLSKEFQLLSQEGYLTKSAILSGLNFIRKANLHDKGLFYSGFFQLSIGLERLMKIVTVLEHKIENNYTNPTDKILRSYGHDIKSLYIKCQETSIKNYNLTSGWFDDSSIEMDIVNFLSKFGKSSRYYNIDVLVDSNKNNDPLKDWSKILNDMLFSCVSSQKRQKIEEESIRIADSIRTNSFFTPFRNLNGEIMTVLDHIVFPRFVEAANPYIIWSIISIMKPFYPLLQEQSFKAQRLQSELRINESVPYMYEFFPFFLSERTQVLRKKQWSWEH